MWWLLLILLAGGGALWLSTRQAQAGLAVPTEDQARGEIIRRMQLDIAAGATKPVPDVDTMSKVYATAYVNANRAQLNALATYLRANGYTRTAEVMAFRASQVT